MNKKLFIYLVKIEKHSLTIKLITKKVKSSFTSEDVFFLYCTIILYKS